MRSVKRRFQDELNSADQVVGRWIVRLSEKNSFLARVCSAVFPLVGCRTSAASFVFKATVALSVRSYSLYLVSEQVS